MTVEFSGREIQASWRGIEATEVVRKVRSFGLEYKRLRAAVESYPGRRPDVPAPLPRRLDFERSG